MKDYNWIYKNPSPILMEEYEKHNVPKLLATILSNRDLSYQNFTKIRLNFWEMVDHYIDNIVNLKEAADRIIYHLTNPNTQILVFTDYDADGITSGATVYGAWNQIAEAYKKNKDFHKPWVFAPERSEGYGLNMDFCIRAVEHLKKERKSLSSEYRKIVVVTFDNGISKNEEIKYLQDNDIEVIVIDHHEPGEILPDCLIVDPKKDKNRFGEELCGSGLSWLLVVAMYYNLRDKKEINLIELNNIVGPKIQQTLINATIGTVADMMPMTHFNLSLVYNGLKYFNQKRENKLPFDKLKDLFGIETVTGKDIGFSLGAAINACGQMGSITSALLFVGNESRYTEQVYKLYNSSRNITRKAKKEIDKALEEGLFKDDYFCIYIAEDIPEGIAGKLANHITEVTGKPAIVTTKQNGEEWKGSARSGNDSIDLLGILQPLIPKGLLKLANGHKAACGVVLYRDKIEQLRMAVNEVVKDLIDNGESTFNVVDDIYIDAAISISDINKNTYKLINEMPYSMNFSNPVFSIRGEILSVKTSSSNPNNICYSIKDLKTKDKTDIWAWNIKPNLYNKKHDKIINIVGNIEPNFMKPGQITMSVIDIKFERK